ncbi:amino acid ABC transporter permease [Nocardioides yefusunii]|uniref:Amino acid ABC transporter permease n=1 Tax=Nocardioides yefusunii TaxID=2500546 RepID=A0ABW1QZZ8_9ACTN|nr:amino acid ABC transporter permease [Nocardioides yefusunii]
MDAVFSNFDEYLKAFSLTIALFVVSGIGALVFGTILASFRVGPVPLLRGFASLYVTLVRNTPLLMIFVLFAIGGVRIGWNFKFVEDIEVFGWNASAFFVRSCIALTVYTSAFVCEALRSGVNSVDLGQAEAARAIGLPFMKVMTLVVLPQAFRAVIGPMTSVIVALIKNTSVAAAFGMAEATATMRIFTNNNADERLGIFLMFAIGYVVIVEVVAFSSYALERKMKVAR